MPSFFSFEQGSDTRSFAPPNTESLRHGRFRAFATTASHRSVGNLFSAFTRASLAANPPARSPSADYGSLRRTAAADEGELPDDDDDDAEPDERWWLDRCLISPRRRVVRTMMRKWWRRWAVLYVLPAAITIAWCAIPFPTTPLPNRGDDGLELQGYRGYDDEPGKSAGRLIWDALRNVFDFSVLWDMFVAWIHRIRDSMPAFDDPVRPPSDGSGDGGRGPGHGGAEVALNFPFFLVVYYGFYNLIALLWITKTFNIYSFNWWPRWLGFPASFTLFNFLPLIVSTLLYHFLPAAIITQNLTWIMLTFTTMLCPLVIAFFVLLYEHRHHHWGRSRAAPSETQLLFTSSPYDTRNLPRWQRARQRFSLPRSYKRFFWFCSALLLSLVGFVLGEAYAELYLQTLPHSNLDTVIYVYSWTATIHILDWTTGYILGARAASYPLGWVFKLFFALTYQTYVRALYARLRSPSQFAYLQLMSSGILVLWSPLTMTKTLWSALQVLGLNGQSYDQYKKTVGRSFFVRGLAENVSMVAWLGWVVVLHYGNNTKIYPYFSFSDTSDDGYTFQLTFFASLATWGCEIVAAWLVRRIMQYGFHFNVTGEAIDDLVHYPELLPACLAVMVHVLQNMLFSIIRLAFYY